MTIGGVDVKLNDMVYAYTAFPNLGILKGVESTVVRPAGNRTLDPVSILRVEDREGNVLYPIVDGKPSADGPELLETRVAPAEQTYMISNILSDGSAQCIVFGCGGLGIGRPMAVKTGTSEPYETIGQIGDTWAIAYTPQLVVGSWFGNADNSPMTGILSTSVSWRTVRDFQVAYHEDLPVEQFTRPAGLVEGQVCIPSGLKVGDGCAVKSQKDLLASDSLPNQDDNWWTVAKIDTRTGKLASALTPEQFVEERFYLDLPAGLSNWQRNQALEWAKELENASEEEPPKDRTEASDLPSAIISPAQAAQLSGPVPVSGRASSEDFIAYRLEYRYDTQPGDWVLIGRRDIQVAEGILGVWDTTGLPFGLYTLRLVVEDDKLGEQEDRVQVLLIGGATVAPTPTVLPEQIE
jgi:membrane carboxypeptidase/penicillin-binding protein PbpC